MKFLDFLLILIFPIFFLVSGSEPQLKNYFSTCPCKGKKKMQDSMISPVECGGEKIFLPSIA